LSIVKSHISLQFIANKVVIDSNKALFLKISLKEQAYWPHFYCCSTRILVLIFKGSVIIRWNWRALEGRFRLVLQSIPSATREHRATVKTLIIIIKSFFEIKIKIYLKKIEWCGIVAALSDCKSGCVHKVLKLQELTIFFRMPRIIF